MVSPYTQHTNSQISTMHPAYTTPPPPFGWCHHTHSISTHTSAQCDQQTQHHRLHLEGVTTYTRSENTTQYRATSTHNNTISFWMVSPFTQHIDSQLSTVQPAHTTPPPPFGWCHHTNSISKRNSAQCNQHTQHNNLYLDGVTTHSK